MDALPFKVGTYGIHKKVYNMNFSNKLWVTVVYRLINNGLEFWCSGVNHACRRPMWFVTRQTAVNEPIYDDISYFTLVLTW